MTVNLSTRIDTSPSILFRPPIRRGTCPLGCVGRGRPRKGKICRRLAGPPASSVPRVGPRRRSERATSPRTYGAKSMSPIFAILIVGRSYSFPCVNMGSFTDAPQGGFVRRLRQPKYRQQTAPFGVEVSSSRGRGSGRSCNWICVTNTEGRELGAVGFEPTKA